VFEEVSGMWVNMPKASELRINMPSWKFLFQLKHISVKFHLQIESLVTEICNTNSVAELELKVSKL